MKFFVVLLAAASLASCNTMIGMGRDTKVAYHWSKEKIQNANSGGSGSGDGTTYDQGAPVY